MTHRLTLYLAAVVASLSSTVLLAQAPPAAPGRGPAPLRSPEVMPDGRVTFRISAPKASDVRLNGEWPDGRNVAMTKDGDGVWSVTAGPLKPEFWMYSYSVDGVRTLDPRNVNTARDGANYLNTFIVDGPASAPYQVADIPHGTLHVDWYASPSLKLTRRVYVYTPPGYSAGTQRYPVFYLLHGGGGDEDAWTTMGRTPQILDYLIAQGKTRPMIVVMTNGNADQTAAQNVVAPVPRPGGMSQSSTGAVIAMAFPESIVADVIPYIEKNYRALPGRESRAIAGLSMGGAQTVYTALTHADQFAWVGAFSAGFPLWPGVRVNKPAPPGSPGRGGVEEHLDPEAVDKLFPKASPKSTAFRLMYLSTGMDDFVLPSVRDFAAWLKSKDIPFVNIETPGYGHVWPYWRICLLDFAPRLFQPDSGARR